MALQEVGGDEPFLGLQPALAVGPNTDLLLLRVAHAAALQRYRVILESANLLIASCALLAVITA